MAHHYITFNFLFLGLLQPVYSMENDNLLYKFFCRAVESAEKKNFPPQACEIIKEYILKKEANPDWLIGKDNNTLLGLAIKFRNRNLFDFLIQNNANINAPNLYGQTPLHLLAIIYNDEKKSNINVKDLVENRANIHAKTNAGLTPLHSAVYSDNIDCLQELVRCGANINEQCKQLTPLEIAVDPIRNAVLPHHRSLDVKMIKELCKLKVLLINETTKNNIFHTIIDLASKNHFALTASGNEPIQQIKTIITNARFDNFDKGSKKTVLFVLWFFEQLEKNDIIKFPKEIKLHILAQLPLFDLYPYKKLCEELLLKNNYNYILFANMYERIENIKQILASPNNENKTALQFTLEKFAHNQEYINKLTPLLDGTLLESDYKYFLEHFPAIINSEKKEDKEHLAYQMFDNCTQLFLQ